jgi:hypothetical protein
MSRAAHAPFRPQVVHQSFFQHPLCLNEEAAVNRFVEHSHARVIGKFQLLVCNFDRQIEFIGQFREVLFRMSQLRLVLTQDRSLTPSIKEPCDAVKALALA